MKRFLFLLPCLFAILFASALLAEPLYLVKDGAPLAEIVISEDPSRTTRLAADELRDYVEKITGARLSISTNPSPDKPVTVYVGQSAHTEKLGITNEGLEFGAYRIASGDNWLVLTGDDSDWVPIEPWPRSNNQIVDGSIQKAWSEITGEDWGFPNSGLRKYYTGSPGRFGTESEEPVDANGKVNVWGFDERGSFNAVCGFLRSLGIRWYMPGEIGEVLPELSSIPLPQVDETVIPAFPVRRFNVRFGTSTRDTADWAMHLGIRDPYGLQVAHGIHTMTHTDAILKKHPDWFALYGGKRDNQPGERLNHLCYSNPELFESTVRWARAQFDHYGLDTVSVMPPDAYISICQCPLCEGKDDPELGSRGKLSNHVWDFVNRVAKEVGKTHPDKQIVCCAYGANTDPPTEIEKLEPNVQVIIVGGRRPRSTLPEQQEEVRQLREAWVKKTDRPIMIFENYPITGRGWYLPAFVARTIGESINATKGISAGEDIWLSFARDFATKNVGFNHHQVYFTARMYWGGPDQDVGAMLEEYCDLFYGPAGEEMLAFFDYCEPNWQAMEEEKEKVDAALNLFDAAKAKVEPGSVYAKRIGFIDEFLESLRSKSEQLGRIRGPVPKLRMVWDAEGIEIDGDLDDDYWKNCPTSSTGRFRELQTGGDPVFDTSVMSGWYGNDLYLAIRCEENPGEKLNIGTTKNGDAALWYGDAIEILIETDSHSYYQIAVNPAGALVDFDRGAAKDAWARWESQAEVATKVSDNQWTVEIRIPVTDDGNDPLNQVIGRKPSASLPWYINLCRQRMRENGNEFSAFSPTGTKAFHEVMKFAHFYDGRSQQFEAAEPDDDYLNANRTADEFYRTGKREEALAEYSELAGRDGLTDFQKCDALGKAAMCARTLKDFEKAEQMAAAAPIEEYARAIRMENLLGERKYEELVAEFGSENISGWLFWIVSPARFARGRAYSALKKGNEAEEDLHAALPYVVDSRTRQSILRSIGHNREFNLEDDTAALETYLSIVESRENSGGAEYFYAVLGANRIQVRKRDFEGAMTTLGYTSPEKMSGTWRGSLFLARAETLAASGKTKEALDLFGSIAADQKVPDRQRKEAVDKAKELEQ